MLTWLMTGLLATFGGRSLYGQSSLLQMYHRSWTVRDGVPNDIYGIVQGADGFLWMTTEDGLYRFDGVSFERYQPPQGSTLLSDRMYAIFAAHDGSLWISYMRGGLSQIKGDRITNFTQKEGLRGGHTGVIAEDKEGRIWVTGEGVQYIQNGRVTLFKDDNGIGADSAENLLFDAAGNLWMPQDPGGLMVLKHGAKNFTVASKTVYEGCSLAHDDGILCIAKGGVLTHFALEQSKINVREMMQGGAELSDVLAARDGTIWLGTSKDGVHRFIDQPGTSSVDGSHSSSPDLETFGRGAGLSGEYVVMLLADREGSLWVVTNRGLDQFRPVPFQEVSLNTARITLPSNKLPSRFFIATDRLAEVVRDKVTYLDQKAEGVARCLYQAADGTVWICSNGLQRYRNGHVEDVPLPPGDDSDRVVMTVVEDASHKIWASLQFRGIYRLDEQGWTKRGGLTGLPNGSASGSLRDHRGDLWFAFRKNTLVRVSSGQVTRFDASKGLNLGDTRVMAERDGALWLGGDQGISVLDYDSFRPFMLSDGKRLRGVSGLAFLSNGDLWINSASGVFQIQHDELLRWDRRSDYLVPWKVFDYLDGMTGIPRLFEDPTAAVASDGMLYLATDRRLQRIDPLHIPKNTVIPTVLITKVVTNIGEKPLSSDIRLDSDTKGLEISYTAPSLLIPERVRFRYQLVGYDKEWIDAGTRRQAFYSKLPAGTYSFRVVACNDSGVWSSKETTTTLVAPPTFIETIWFRLVAILFAVALLYVGFRLRMRHLKRSLTQRLYERFAERERIARDLHDTLFQGVEGGLLVISSVTSRTPMEPSAKEKLQEAFRELNQIMASARSLIFEQGKPVESFEFEGVVTAYGEQVGLLSESRLRVASSGTKREIKLAVREELLKIVKESLSNAFRHARAKEIDVLIVYSRVALEIFVSDDGVGIDSSILEEGGRPGHWGMRSMRQRAATIGGQFKMRRREGGGTEVLIRVPASRAFRSRAMELSAKWFGRRVDAQDTTN